MAARGCLRVVNILNKRSLCKTSDFINTYCVVLQSGCNSVDSTLLNRYSHLASRSDGLDKVTAIQEEQSIKTETRPPSLIGERHGRGMCTRVLQDGEESDDFDDALDDQTSFDKYGVSPEIQQKLKAAGIHDLFPVQYETFQRTIEGKDVIVQARTGTGKTLSFALPLVQVMEGSFSGIAGRKPKVIILAPTRELACQVKADFEKLTDCLSLCAIYGGTAYEPQERSIRSGVDIVVGTPGRVMDLIERRILNLSEIEHVVLDEVDRMLDMGFADSVEKIIRGCYTRGVTPQTLMYSATMPTWVNQTARKYLKDDYETVNLIDNQRMRTSITVEQLAIKCHYTERPSVISDIVKVYAGQHGRAIVFCKTKREADELCTGTLSRGSAVLHGDVPQAKREMVIQSFKDGKTKVLLTTDVAARGLDIPDVNLVIQTQPPEDVDSFVHRTGRTGRAGKSGVAICFYQQSETEQLWRCEKAAKLKMRHIRCPNTEEVIKASARDAARSLEDIPEETIDYFRTSAEEMIQQRGAVESLAAAMAVITGATKIATRSLLSNKQGYTTYIYKANVEMRGLGLARSIVRQLLGDNADVRSFTFTEDKRGVVFDVHSDYVDDLELFIPRPGESLEKAQTLPPLSEHFNRGFDRDSSGYRGGQQRSSWNRGEKSFPHRQDYKWGQNKYPNRRNNKYNNKYSWDQNYTSFRDFHTGMTVRVSERFDWRLSDWLQSCWNYVTGRRGH